jgi:hypothetical protein
LKLLNISLAKSEATILSQLDNSKNLGRESSSPKLARSRREGAWSRSRVGLRLLSDAISAVRFFLMLWRFRGSCQKPTSRIHPICASWTAMISSSFSLFFKITYLPFGTTNISLRNALSILVVPLDSDQALSNAADRILDARVSRIVAVSS